MRSLSRPAAFAVILALVLALVPVTTALAVLPDPPVGAVQLNDVVFTDASHGWAVGGFQSAGKDYAVVERTTDGGVTWTRNTVLGQPDAHQFHSISIPDGTTGFAADAATWNRVYKTTDAGATWSPMIITSDPTDTTNVIDQVAFTDATHGYAAGRSLSRKVGVVWATSNGGTSWTRVYEGPQSFDDETGQPTGDNQLLGLSGYSSGNQIAVGVDNATGLGTAYRYAGSVWATQTLPAGVLTLASVSYPDSTHAMAVGPRGRVLKFNGTAWANVVSGIVSDLEDVAYADATHAWVVGVSGVIRFYNGTSFVAQTSGTSSVLRGVHFRDASNGWAVGDGDKVLRTTDGGAHWYTRENTPPATTIAGVPAGWTKGNVAFTLSATDAGTGVSETYYRLDGGSATPYPDSAVTISAEGTTTIEYWSTDVWGNVESAHTAYARIDKTPPSTTDDHAVNYAGPSTIHLTPTDALSGVAGTSWRLDGGVVQAGTNVPVSGAGSHTLTYWSLDNAGNTESTRTATYTVDAPPPGDTSKPTTTIESASGGPLPTDWFAGSIAFKLIATDEPTNTVTTYYRIDSGGLQVGTPGAPPVETLGSVTQDGTHTITYYSVDQASMVEVANTTIVKVDKSAPVSTITTSGARVTLSAVDPYSGVDYINVRVGTGLDTHYSSPHTITLPAGTHRVYYWAADMKGNRETERHIDVTVPPAPTFIPVEGTDRFGTAVAAVEQAFPAGSNTVVLAYAGNFPDALGASALCGAWKAPLLLAQKTYIPTSVQNEITHLNAKHAIIVGNVLTQAVVDELHALGVTTVDRIGGADRFDTAGKVAAATVTKLGAASADDVFLAVGDNFPDALAASPAAFYKCWPILLTPRAGLSSYTRAALVARGVKRVHILGSTSTISTDIENDLKNTYGLTVDRWKGDNRYGTAVDIANRSGLPFNGIALAKGTDFPDALAGGVMAGMLRGPVLLTAPLGLSAETSAAIVAHKAEIGTVRYLGSTSALGPAVRASVESLLH